MSDATNLTHPAGAPGRPEQASGPGPVPQDAWVGASRVGPRRYRGVNRQGTEVLMGPEGTPGAFTPGELLGIALAGCAGMSADSALVRHLGEDPVITIGIERVKHAREDRYEALTEHLAAPLAALSAPERERLATVITRAIDKACTVGNTLKAGADVTVTLS